MASFTAAGTAYVELRRGDDSVLHLLLHVRVPARGRPDLGLRRRARQGLPVRRHGRAHHAFRRRPAAPGRPQPAAGQHRAHLRRLRSGVRLRDRRHRAGRHPPHVPGAARTCFYYLTLYNENYPMPPMPEGLDPEGMLKGIYRLPAPAEEGKAVVQLVRQRPDSQRSAARAADSGRSSTAWPPTCGASPATTNCGARRWRWSAGTACTPTSRRARRTSSRRSKAPRAPSWRPPIT